MSLFLIALGTAIAASYGIGPCIGAVAVSFGWALWWRRSTASAGRPHDDA